MDAERMRWTQWLPLVGFACPVALFTVGTRIGYGLVDAAQELCGLNAYVACAALSALLACALMVPTILGRLRVKRPKAAARTVATAAGALATCAFALCALTTGQAPAWAGAAMGVCAGVFLAISFALWVETLARQPLFPASLGTLFGFALAGLLVWLTVLIGSPVSVAVLMAVCTIGSALCLGRLAATPQAPQPPCEEDRPSLPHFSRPATLCLYLRMFCCGIIVAPGQQMGAAVSYRSLLGLVGCLLVCLAIVAALSPRRDTLSSERAAHLGACALPACIVFFALSVMPYLYAAAEAARLIMPLFFDAAVAVMICAYVLDARLAFDRWGERFLCLTCVDFAIGIVLFSAGFACFALFGSDAPAIQLIVEIVLLAYLALTSMVREMPREMAETTCAHVPVDDAVGTSLGLSAREAQVFARLAAGQTPQQIASSLEISTNTVLTHRRNIYTKLDVHRDTDLVRLALGREPGPQERADA